MTRWFLLWTVLLLAVAAYGAGRECLWLSVMPVLLLPIVYADQYLAAHYSEEES